MVEAECENVALVTFDWVSQRFYGGDVFPASTDSAKVTFDSSLFQYINDNHRLGMYDLGLDPKNVYLVFDSPAERIEGVDQSDPTELSQVWLFKALNPGVNVIHARLCHPRSEPEASPTPPSTDSEHVISFSFPIYVGGKPEIAADLVASLPDSSFVLAKHLPEGIDTSFQNVVFWGVTREAISQEANVTLSDDQWNNFCDVLDSSMQRVFDNNIEDACDSAISEDSETEDDPEVSELTYSLSDADRVIYSSDPSKDSAPHYIFLERQNLTDLTDAQWESVQGSIISRQQEYLMGYLPFLLEEISE